MWRRRWRLIIRQCSINIASKENWYSTTVCNLFSQDGEYKLWYINIEESIFDIDTPKLMLLTPKDVTSILYSERAGEYFKHFVQNFINLILCINICNFNNILSVLTRETYRWQKDDNIQQQLYYIINNDFCIYIKGDTIRI